VTPEELIDVIENAGGKLEVKDGKLACDIPQAMEHLIPELKAQKDAVIQILRHRASGIPCPGYNRDQPFTCDKCGVHFDTSAGIAQHQVNVCGWDGAKFALASSP
jgi:hypothetical protein